MPCRVTKAGDSRGVRGVKLSWIILFLNRAGSDDSICTNSKYAYYLIRDHIDYKRSSTRLKYRLDRRATLNTSGCYGHNIEHDLSNEHYNKCCRKLWKSAYCAMTPLRAERMMLGMNATENIKEQVETSVGWSDGKGGETSHQKLTEDEFEEIRFQFISKRPYDKDLSRGNFDEKLGTIYGGSGLTDSNLRSFFDKQQHSYKLEHQFTSY